MPPVMGGISFHPIGAWLPVGAVCLDAFTGDTNMRPNVEKVQDEARKFGLVLGTTGFVGFALEDEFGATQALWAILGGMVMVVIGALEREREESQ